MITFVARNQTRNKTMKRLLPFIFLLWAIQTNSQVPLDSAYWDTEMEDSISAMSIVPIKHPKELLDSIIVQVIRDSKQKPVRCMYQTMYTTDLHTSSPATSRCILHAIANIKIKATGKGEKFHYEGPILPKNLNDTARVYFVLRDLLESSLLICMQEDNYFYTVPVFHEFKRWMSMHHIKVYRISDESGRGVYRVDFSPKKNIGYGFHGTKFDGTAYFDKKTLRVIQIKTDLIQPSSFDVLGRQDKDGLLSHTVCIREQTAFEEVGDTLVVKQEERTHFVDGYLTSKYQAQRLP